MKTLIESMREIKFSDKNLTPKIIMQNRMKRIIRSILYKFENGENIQVEIDYMEDMFKSDNYFKLLYWDCYHSLSIEKYKTDSIYNCLGQ